MYLYSCTAVYIEIRLSMGGQVAIFTDLITLTETGRAGCAVCVLAGVIGELYSRRAVCMPGEGAGRVIDVRGEGGRRH